MVQTPPPFTKFENKGGEREKENREKNKVTFLPAWVLEGEHTGSNQGLCWTLISLNPGLLITLFLFLSPSKQKMIVVSLAASNYFSSNLPFIKKDGLPLVEETPLMWKCTEKYRNIRNCLDRTRKLINDFYWSEMNRHWAGVGKKARQMELCLHLFIQSVVPLIFVTHATK